jgi:diguanylate cyclase (GGDEF)-like protein
MALLTVGLVGWRREQFVLSEHMEQRERLFRDHRAFDRITQLASTDYLREQLLHERAQRPDAKCALLLLEIDGLQPLWREHGRRDAVRALRAVTHQLLLNLRRDDLLCRAAGDRLVVLLPATPEAEAERRAVHLARMVRLMGFDVGSDAPRSVLGLRWACAEVDAQADAGALLAQLARRLEAAHATGDAPQPA